MRPKPRSRFSKRLPIALFAALLTLGLAAIDVGPASAGPTASVAKKKCSKKKRKKHKCGKSGGDPVAALTALFAGSSISSVSNGTSGGGPGTNTDVYKFCRNGTYRRQIDNVGTGETPFHRVTTYAGAWKFTDGLRRKTGELKGGLTTTVDSFQDSDGADPPPPEVLPFVDTVVVPAGEPFIVIGDHPAWTRTPGGAGC
jgi:hypothetical protein